MTTPQNTFNDKYIFLFGGKKLTSTATMLPQGERPYEFVKAVDVYDIDKNSWKTLNFVSESEKLMILNPGCL